MASLMLRAAPLLIVLLADLSAIGHAIPSHFKGRPSRSNWSHLKSDHWKGVGGQWSDCGYLDVCEVCVNGTVMNADEGTACPDAYHCNGEEYCNANGECVAGVAVDCDEILTDADFGSIHHNCGKKVCSERHKGCKVAINPVYCNDGDPCTENDSCDLWDGSCKGTPKFCSACSECKVPTSTFAAAGAEPVASCVSHCDTAAGKTCKYDKCVDAPPPPGTCGNTTCSACEVCKWGKCVEKYCGPCKTCDAGVCVGCDACSECKWGKCVEKDLGCPACAPCVDGTCTDNCSPEKVDGVTGKSTICDAGTEECVVACTNDTHCTGACTECHEESGKCVYKCTDHQVCDSSMDTCKALECTTDGKKDCPFTCQECVDHMCKSDNCTCPGDAPDDCSNCEKCVVNGTRIEDSMLVLDTTCMYACDSDTKCTTDGCKPFECSNNGDCSGCQTCEDHACTGDCPPDDTNCTTMFDMYCYKCGVQPLSCLVIGNPDVHQLDQIRTQINATCLPAPLDNNQNGQSTSNTVLKTPCDQQCATPGQDRTIQFLINVAPNILDMDGLMTQCIFPTTFDGACPCVANGLSNFNKYTVCVDLDEADMPKVAIECGDKCEESSSEPCPDDDLGNITDLTTCMNALLCDDETPGSDIVTA